MVKRLIAFTLMIMAIGFLFSSITLISPNGGETWTPGYNNHITWWSANETGNIKIELYRYTSLVATISASTLLSSGSYYWVLPFTMTPASNYTIKITSLNNASVYDWCNAFFTVGPAPTLTVTSPNGGENWFKGGTYTITYSTTNLTGSVYMMLDYSLGPNMTITPGTTGSYSWTIPNTIVGNGNFYKIEVVSNTVSALRDFSNNFFSINDLPIAITAPSGGEIWYTGSTYDINWTSDNVAGNAKVELFQGTNTTPTLSIVISTVMSYDHCVWTIPASMTPGNAYRIKLTSITTPTMYDYSAYFTISNPVGNEDPLVTPNVTALEEVFPNPFKTDTTVKYSVREAENLALMIFDVKGRLVRRLINTKSSAGTFSTTWNGTDESGNQLPNGVYYMQMKTDTYQTTKKMVLLR